MVTLDPDRIALQLYTVRAPLQADFLGTLQGVADAGFRAVEFAGFGPFSPAELRGEIDRLGLRVAGAHVPLAQWEARPEGVIADLQTLGCPYGVVPFVPEDQRGGLSAARGLAANLNRWGALCREQGLGFAYHHHAFEFDVLPGTVDLTLFEVIVTQTDPANVGLEIDVYWAAQGMQDPVALLQRLAGRVPLVHLKDLGPAPDFADLPVGAGTLPWDRILPAAEAAGAQWFIVEQDHPADPLADAAASLAALTEGVGGSRPRRAACGGCESEGMRGDPGGVRAAQRLAKRDDARRRRLRRFGALADVGDVRTGAPGAASRGFRAGEHRRRAWTNWSARIPASPLDRERIAL